MLDEMRSLVGDGPRADDELAAIEEDVLAGSRERAGKYIP
jgi:hypothetical protein